MATLFSDILRGLRVLLDAVLRRRRALVPVRVVESVVFAVVLAASSSSAWATCGDWLAHPDGATNAAAQSHDESDAASPADNLPAPDSAPRPCNGPFCGRGPTAPAAPTPVQIPAERDHVLAALAEQLGDAAADNSSHRLLPADVAPLAGHSRRIDHPPQA